MRFLFIKKMYLKDGKEKEKEKEKEKDKKMEFKKEDFTIDKKKDDLDYTYMNGNTLIGKGKYSKKIKLNY